MSARTVRRTFATPFVVTLAAPLVACVTQPRHVYDNPPPPHREPPPPDRDPSSPPPDTTPAPEAGPPRVMVNPPRPGANAMETDERHWTVTRQGDKCQAFSDVTCPAQATCNPPPPRAYTCLADITPTQPLKIVRWAGQTECVVQREMPKCPPKVMCNPPPPQKVACPE